MIKSIRPLTVLIVFVLAALFFTACKTPPPEPPPLPPEKQTIIGPWGTEWHPYEKGVRIAREQKKPVFISFVSEGCKWCRSMEKDTYGNKTVAEYLKKNFILVLVDTREEKEIRKEYAVRGVPSFAFLEPSGAKSTVRLGYMGASEFLSVIKAYNGNRPKGV